MLHYTAVLAGTLLGCSTPATPRSSGAAGDTVAEPSPVASATSRPEGSVTSRLITTRYGTFGLLPEAVVFVGLERGYFQDEGIALEPVVVRTLDELLVSLTQDQFSAATVPITAGIFNAVARGVPIRIVAPIATNLPGASSGFVMVRKELVESGEVADWPDLRGRRLVTGVSPPSADYLVKLVLERAQLDVNGLELGELSNADTLPAFVNKGIDVAFVGEPSATLAENLGVAVKWRSVADLRPGVQILVVVFGPAWLGREAEMGRRWMAAYLRGARDYRATLNRPDGRRELATILTRHTPVQDVGLYDRMAFVGVDPNLRLNETNLAEQLAWFKQQGLVTAPVELHQSVDLAFARYAVERLGPST